MDEKGAGGRPSLYDKAYCKAVIEHMSNGASGSSGPARAGSG